MVDSEGIIPTPLTQAVAYCRMSPKPEHKKSLDPIETQIAICEAYCRMHGLACVKVFSDPHVSGRCTRFMQRGGATDMVEYCEEHGIKNIVVQRLDRAFRDTIDGLTTIETLNESGIRMHLAAEGGLSCDLSSAEGKLVLTMLLAFASFEPERIARRTSEGLQRRQADGRRVTRADRVRYGQDERYPEELANLRTACTLLSQGQSIVQVSSELHAAHARRRNGRAIGQSFLRDQVRWLLSNQRHVVAEWTGEQGLKTVERKVGDTPAANVRESKPADVATSATLSPPLAEMMNKRKDIP